MNKPTLSLALSVSLALAQAGWQIAQSKPASGAIWQHMAGTAAPTKKQSTNKKVVAKVQKATVAPKRVNTKSTKPSPAVSNNEIDESHAYLFLPGKDKSANALGGGPAPAAALSIHPSLPTAIDTPTLAESQSTTPSVDTSSEIPIHELVNSAEAVPTKSNDLLAQFNSDNILAQADNSGAITASPIPPVVTGTVDFEEFKPTNVIDLKVSRSRTFKLRNKVVRTSISDPGVAEPVIVAENQMVLLGKSPGRATLVLWDDAGNSSAIDLRCSRDYTQLQSTLREIDPRIIVKTYSVSGSDRLVLLGDVDHVESVIRAFAAANVYMDDRGMNIQVANNRLINARIGESGGSGGGGGGGGGAGGLAQLNSVDKYTFFPNYNNNVSMAQGITSDGGRVTSLLKVRKVPLIALHVTFMEMNTTAARSLGTSLGLNFSGSGFGFGVGGLGPSQALPDGTYLLSEPGATQQLPVNTNLFPGTAPIGAPSAFNTVPVGFLAPIGLNGGLSGVGLPGFATASQLLSQQVLLGAPGGASFSSGGLGNLFNAISNFAINERQKFSVNPRVVGSITHNRARILAEPTLVTISGERASFLAGGEIPILQTIATAGQSQFSVTFEPFGMRINMIPVLLESGTINLEISPEERIVSNTFAFNFPNSNTNIPGFTTRKAQTIVELKPGQELFIGGLISTNNGRELSKYPIFGEIPVVGAMWRSKAWNKNESELVVAVRPEIILPGTPGQLKLPEEIGRVEGPRDMNMFQVEPTVVDERHYTSGRAERHQKTSPTLPEGAPIPDSR
ncbi:MAG: pilus assembly protein N-terminal domain-containing protein [Candidatus Obscuribacterales bacterium]|nr:pilus assembly protein N-terminal domain-containing protein [Candidatus Obscuribacterales bacterium]